MKEKSFNICSWCNQPSTIIWVHGHGQCSVCGINVDECCRGEQDDNNFVEPEKAKREEADTKDD